MPELNNQYTENGIAAEKYLNETITMANATYQKNGTDAEEYMNETGRLSSSML